tara:strand:- start:27 stop:305 length:279 start_codon:yes stop_codon:yes gene_type:complete
MINANSKETLQSDSQTVTNVGNNDNPETNQTNEQDEPKERVPKKNYPKVSPCSPLKVGGYNRENIIPYGSLNKKTYFKTLEHIIQNTNNKTY